MRTFWESSIAPSTSLSSSMSWCGCCSSKVTLSKTHSGHRSASASAQRSDPSRARPKPCARDNNYPNQELHPPGRPVASPATTPCIPTRHRSTPARRGPNSAAGRVARLQAEVVRERRLVQQVDDLADLRRHRVHTPLCTCYAFYHARRSAHTNTPTRTGTRKHTQR